MKNNYCRHTGWSDLFEGRCDLRHIFVRSGVSGSDYWARLVRGGSLDLVIALHQ